MGLHRLDPKGWGGSSGVMDCPGQETSFCRSALGGSPEKGLGPPEPPSRKEPAVKEVLM